MPRFQRIPLHEARLKTATGRAARYLGEYVDYIQQLDHDQAGTLVAAEGESVLTIRRRLTAAAEVLGKTLVVKRTGEQIYFWVEPSQEEPKASRRGYRRKAQNAEDAGAGE